MTKQKFLRALWIGILYLGIPSVMFAFTKMFQPPGMITPPDFPYIVFIPYALGILLHWLKKYTADGMKVNFFAYLVTNIGGTITSLILGVGSLWAMYASAGNGGLVPVTIGTWLSVFWIGVGSDTVNSTMTASTLKANDNTTP